MTDQLDDPGRAFFERITLRLAHVDVATGFEKEAALLVTASLANGEGMYRLCEGLLLLAPQGGQVKR